MGQIRSLRNDLAVNRAKALRRLDTNAEAHPWNALRARRTAYIERAGLRVLRFWNSAVLTNRDGVCLTILSASNTPPLPRRAAPRGRG